ncbi:MAG TPA: ABC transporter substrate-binding protein [Candidatus Polarisedimenticolia bacterium]|nr:ABC transporter substrate-binding protein [Candidatus Polarisedimenticolia bacterium]
MLLGPAFAAGLTLAACARRPADPTGVTVIVDGGPASLDPRLGSDEASRRVYDLIFNALFRLTDDGGTTPDLAVSSEAPDDRTLVVHLRDGVRFHDGALLTSEDVAFTYRSILEGEVVSFRRADFEAVESVSAPDAATVVFHLRRPFAPLLSNLTVPILRAGTGAEAARTPVGTGPFRLIRSRKDEDLLLGRFEGYFEGPSPLTSVRIRILPAESARLLEMLRGSGDLVVNDLAPEHFDRLDRTPGFEVAAHDGRNVVYLGFNLAHPPLDDPRVRRAIALAVDRDAIVRHLLSGRARLATALLPPGHWAHDDTVPIRPHDPGEAGRLLDAAGHPDPDGSGPAVRFHLRYSAPQSEQAAQIASVLQDDLAQVGIALDVFTFEWPTFYDDLRSGRFEIVTSNWTDIGDPDIYRLRFHSAFRPPNGLNRGSYVNPEADRLIEAGAARADRPGRIVIYARLQRLLDTDLPCAWLWHRQVRSASGPRLRGFTLDAGADFRPLWRARVVTSGEFSAQGGLDGERGDRPGADEMRRIDAQVHDGGRRPSVGAAAVQDQVDAVLELIGRFARRSGRGLAALVGAGGDDGAAERPRQAAGDGMRREPHTDGPSTTEQALGQRRRGKEEREGTRPEGGDERLRSLRHLRGDAGQVAEVADDDRQRHHTRASLRGKHLLHGRRVERIRSERIKGFRGIGDESAFPQHGGGRLKRVRSGAFRIDRDDLRRHGARGHYSAALREVRA